MIKKKQILRFLNCTMWAARDLSFLGEGVANPSLTNIGLFCHCLLNFFVRTPYNPSASLPWDRLVKICLSSSSKEALLERYMVHFPVLYRHDNKEAYLSYALHRAANRYITRYCEKIQVSRRVSVSEKNRDALTDYFAEDNRKLMADHGLQLDKNGWVH